MSTQADLDKLSVHAFTERFGESMTPLSNTFSYFPAMPLTEEDVRDYLEEPIAAVPPSILPLLPKVSILLVPYLEKPNGREKENGPVELVSFERPPEHRQAWCVQAASHGRVSLVFAIKDRQVADYHYSFFNAIASLVSQHCSEETSARFSTLLRKELGGGIHGEVDRSGWELKQALLRRQTNVRRETKLFREYARQSFIDTLTLYLHGICCDIDVEMGPRQLPSRCLRARLELLESVYPPPEGYAVFPEESKKS